MDVLPIGQRRTHHTQIVRVQIAPKAARAAVRTARRDGDRVQGRQIAELLDDRPLAHVVDVQSAIVADADQRIGVGGRPAEVGARCIGVRSDQLEDGLLGLDVENGDGAGVRGDAQLEAFGGMEAGQGGAGCSFIS